jgi:hypothetical protein
MEEKIVDMTITKNEINSYLKLEEMSVVISILQDLRWHLHVFQSS